MLVTCTKSHYGIPDTIWLSGKINTYSNKSSAPINKNLIEESATELFGADQAARLMKHVKDRTAVTEKMRMKRVSLPSNKATAKASNPKKVGAQTTG